MSPDKIAVAREMYGSRRYTVATIAKTLGVSSASIYRHLPAAVAAQAAGAEDAKERMQRVVIKAAATSRLLIRALTRGPDWTARCC